VTAFGTLRRPDGVDRVPLAQDSHALIQALQRLPVEERRCLELRLNGHLSTERIAATLQLPAGSVRQMQLSALRLLSRELAAPSADSTSAAGATADPA
jgi:DNA-directed RNA polymerase specialized sigma24 family protein